MTNEFTTLDTTRIAEQVGFTSAPNKMTWTMLHKFAMIVHQEASSKVESLEAQRQQLREALKEVLAAERFSNRVPETVMQAEAKLDRIRKASAQAGAALKATE